MWVKPKQRRQPTCRLWVPVLHWYLHPHSPPLKHAALAMFPCYLLHLLVSRCADFIHQRANWLVSSTCQVHQMNSQLVSYQGLHGPLSVTPQIYRHSHMHSHRVDIYARATTVTARRFPHNLLVICRSHDLAYY